MKELTKSGELVLAPIAGVDNTLLGHWNSIRKSLVWILLTTVCSGVAGYLIAIRQTPVYRAIAKIEVLETNPNFLNARDLSPTEPGSGGPIAATGYLDTQVQVLQTKRLARRVIDKVGTPPETRTVTAGNSLMRGGLPATPAQLDQALQHVESKLNIRGGPQGNILEIEFDSVNPQYAAKFVNTLTEEYIDDNLQARWSNVQKTADWLHKKLDDLKTEMESSEDELQKYTTASGLLVTEDKHMLAEEKLRQIQQELSVAQADRMTKESQYHLVTKSAVDDLPAVIDHLPLREIQLRVMDLKRQYAELSSILTPTNYKVQKLQAQISTLEVAATSERTRVVERLRNEFDTAKYRQELLSKAYQTQADLTSQQARLRIRYDTLKHNVETNRTLYADILQKTKTIGIASAMSTSNLRIIDPATEPSVPSKPIPILGAAAGGLGGAILSIGTILVRRFSRSGVQRPGEAALYLNVRELGAIPSAKLDRNVFGGEPLTHSKQLPWPQRALTATSNQPMPVSNLIDDSFQAIVTSVLFACGERNKVFVVTSPYAKDGKTTIVSRLAMTLAETGRKVLLIDADFRAPRLQELFDLPNNNGLGDLFSGKVAPEKLDIAPLLHRTKVPTLSVMTSGRWENSFGLFHQTRTQELFDRVRSEFDVTLVDTPPLMLTPTARLLGRAADSVILVLRAGKTSLETAALCQQRLDHDGVSLLGTILNDWQVDTSVHEYYAVKS